MQKEFSSVAQDLEDYWPSINWVVHPTEAPWRNRAIEAIVKQSKSSLNMLPNFKLTLIDEISTSINNKQLGVLQDS